MACAQILIGVEVTMWSLSNNTCKILGEGGVMVLIVWWKRTGQGQNLLVIHIKGTIKMLRNQESS